MTRPISSASTTAVPAAALLLLCLTAGLGWAALGTEFVRSIGSSLAKGLSLGEALFRFFRYFTILTNIGIATLMSLGALRLIRGERLPRASVFNAALVYILVTFVTYEAVLRRTWSPHGVQLVTDTIIHDVVPMLTLVAWLFFAPRSGARWRDALWILVYPAIFFAFTLAAGAAGEGYPYGFLDVDKIGLVNVLEVAAIFLAVFYVLGLGTTAITRARDSQRRRARVQIAS